MAEVVEFVTVDLHLTKLKGKIQVTKEPPLRIKVLDYLLVRTKGEIGRSELGKYVHDALKGDEELGKVVQSVMWQSKTDPSSAWAKRSVHVVTLEGLPVLLAKLPERCQDRARDKRDRGAFFEFWLENQKNGAAAEDPKESNEREPERSPEQAEAQEQGQVKVRVQPPTIPPHVQAEGHRWLEQGRAPGQGQARGKDPWEGAQFSGSLASASGLEQARLLAEIEEYRAKAAQSVLERKRAEAQGNALEKTGHLPPQPDALLQAFYVFLLAREAEHEEFVERIKADMALFRRFYRLPQGSLADFES